MASLGHNDLMPLDFFITWSFSPYYSQKAPHSSPVTSRVSYGVSFVSSNSGVPNSQMYFGYYKAMEKKSQVFYYLLQ